MLKLSLKEYDPKTDRATYTARVHYGSRGYDVSVVLTPGTEADQHVRIEAISIERETTDEAFKVLGQIFYALGALFSSIEARSPLPREFVMEDPLNV